MTQATQDKRVSSAELFFDLVFVFAVTEVSAVLGHDHSWAGLLRALVVFVPIYWMWVGTSIQTNLRDTSRPALWLTIFTVALAAVFMALALPDAYGDLGLLFAISYWVGRLVLGMTLLRRSALAATGSVNPYTISMFMTAPLLVVGALLPSGARELVWAGAALLDLSTPSILRARMRMMRFDAGHLAERFSLFVLIALGESVVAIGVSARSGQHLTFAVGCAVAAAFVLSCGLWWVYFAFAAEAIQHALSTAKVQLDITRLVLSYGHLSFVAAIILLAVGMGDAVAEPGHHLGWAGAGLLYGGAALYLATFGFTRWAMFRLVSTTRLAAATVVVVLMPAAAYLPALAALAALALTVAVLNLVEFMRVEQQGWRARLGRRADNRSSTG
ncbi:MAG: low temperature requirement protein A [Pseudonocardiales bacterium]|nr:MAG: low temperature requirement protein A [Pseudonocardiales bacterium]